MKNGRCTGTLVADMKTEKTAHCIEFDPSGQFAFVPHTKPNKVYQFRWNDKTGQLSPNTPAFVVGPDENHNYHQPRHYAHYPRLKVAYTSNEKGGGITAWSFDPKSGTLSKMQTLATLAPTFKGQSAGADIHITPDGRFAYVSNRDLVKKGSKKSPKDTLAAFSLNPKTGRMKLIGHFPTAHFPRTFCIDLQGRFVYAAGQKSDELYAYRIDQKTGALTLLKTYKTGRVPIWAMCGAVQED